MRGLVGGIPVATRSWRSFTCAAALILLATACAANDASPVDIVGANDFGVTTEDVLHGLHAREQNILQCMEDRGLQYTVRDPSGDVIADRDHPGWGMAHSLLETIRSASGSGEPAGQPRAGASQPGYQDALIACANEADAARLDRQRAVASSSARLDRAWQEFHASTDYTRAAQAWSECMRTLGYQVDRPSEVADDFGERLLRLVEGAGGPERVAEAEAEAFMHEEVTLRAADDGCRADTVDAVVRTFKRQLFSDEADAVARIRDAARN
jgi:hypothetical protein